MLLDYINIKKANFSTLLNLYDYKLETRVSRKNVSYYKFSGLRAEQ